MLIRPQVIDPKFLCPRFLARGFPVEEQHVCFDTLGVKDAGRQAQQGVNICLLQSLTSDGLSGTAFKKDIVRDNNGGPSMLLEDREDVLEEVKLFVTRRGPEI